MKKIALMSLVLCAILALCACTPNAAGNGQSQDSTIPVTSPNGFEDVTAPPEDTTNKSDDEETEKGTESDETEKVSSGTVTTPDEAIEKARQYKGELDNSTGYKLAYSYDGTMTDNGTEYFKIRVSWYIEEEERYSKCGYILVSPDGDCSEYDW